MENRRKQMDQQIGKAKGVASNHPMTVRDDSFPFDLDNCRYRDEQPNEIQRIEAHAADFTSGGVRRHVSGSQHDEQDGPCINVAVAAMEPMAFLANAR